MLPMPPTPVRTALSVNVNKVALVRNTRHLGIPSVTRAATLCLQAGAHIEGNCSEDKFVQLVLDTRPAQVTLVPDAVNQLTSNQGWNTIQHQDYLKNMIGIFKAAGIRTSVFVDPIGEIVEGAAQTGTDRIELYTESYAKYFAEGSKEKAIEPYLAAALKANELGIGINGGHDLDLHNLRWFSQNIPGLLEVSIGHALICDALYYGLENTVQLYKRQLHG